MLPLASYSDCLYRIIQRCSSDIRTTAAGGLRHIAFRHISSSHCGPSKTLRPINTESMPRLTISSLSFRRTCVSMSTAVKPQSLKRPSLSQKHLPSNPRRTMSTADQKTLPRLPILQAIESHNPTSVAVVHSQSGRTFTYGEILADVARTKQQLEEAQGSSDLSGQRIAFIVENSYDYVVTLLACLAAKAIAIPLSPAFPAPELQYIIDQSESSMLVSSAMFKSKAKQVMETNLKSKPTYFEIEKQTGSELSRGTRVVLEGDDLGDAAMMLYTSGTTSRPKGVLLPQSVLTAQCRSLHQAWEYTASDRLLHVLPLHHIHGTVNALLTPLFAGSTVEFLFPFNADAVWNRLASPFLATHGSSPPQNPITFFTVVPTVYSRLLSSHKGLDPEIQAAARTAISPPHMRLNISGSAALPTPVKTAWSTLSHGNVLLERYGMTEVGMALSCGLPYSSRVDASVGWPLPSVEARLIDVDTGKIIHQGEEIGPDGRERSGEVQLRGPTIFQEYWRNPEATASEFVDADDGKGKWFKTGDVAVRRSVPSVTSSTPPSSPIATSEGKHHHHHREPRWDQGPMYFIQGRKSADIIKTGGEKVSALEVERELLSLSQIAEAAVVAVPSGKWGQKVGAVIILNHEHVSNNGGNASPEDSSKTVKWGPMDMRRALKGRLANYKIPQVMKIVDHIPRNAMGKINKKELVKAVFEDEVSDDEN